MQGWTKPGVIALTLGLPIGVALATASFAAPAVGVDPTYGNQPRRLPPYLQCVPYARQVSGIAIYGDARTWWGQAAGRYERGDRPRVGAVMAFKPHGNMRLGHVAAVSRIIDSRTVLLRHANWSPINGRRGQIEDDVRAIDVSAVNDWSAVRVWYGPIEAIGSTAWPVAGFIYNRPAHISEPSFQFARTVQPRRHAEQTYPIRVTLASNPQAQPAPRIAYAMLDLSR